MNYVMCFWQSLLSACTNLVKYLSAGLIIFIWEQDVMVGIVSLSQIFPAFLLFIASSIFSIQAGQSPIFLYIFELVYNECLWLPVSIRTVIFESMIVSFKAHFLTRSV